MASVNDRFWEKVAVGEGCWLWTGAPSRLGYGRLWVNGRMVMAHRLSYEAHKGPIADGLVINHLCGVRRCVNPDHLCMTTQRINTLRSESLPAQNARKTACDHGHPFVEDNIGWHNGERYCRACKTLPSRARTTAKVESCG